ncbi:MAG: aspartyl-phosphate phosphatase Spo0E family protein [Clostridiales bacterium]|mgnify:CR=1 FL=1|nr:aspartyl-phosphate phosphatase Spo0E family protein [Clostridiales bacterium]
MGEIETLNKDIEELRGQLNKLIVKNIDGSELLMVSQQLDELLLKYYKAMGEQEDSK